MTDPKWVDKLVIVTQITMAILGCALLVLLLTGCDGPAYRNTMTPDEVFALQTHCVALGLKPSTYVNNGDTYSVTCETTVRGHTIATPKTEMSYNGIKPLNTLTGPAK